MIDLLITSLDRFSVWLRWRWGMSHHEVAAFLLGLVTPSALYAPFFVQTLVLLLLSVVLLCINVYKAGIHNKPSAVGSWSSFSRAYFTMQVSFGLIGATSVVLAGQTAMFISSTGYALVLILTDFPGRKVDHEPPAKGKWVTAR